MGLSILTDRTGQAAGAALVTAVRRALTRGTATVLVPSSRLGLEVRRSLADQGVGLGVSVVTVAAWLEGLWRAQGDGRRLATAAETRACAWLAVREDPTLLATAGTVALVASLAGQPLGAPLPGGLSEQQRAALCAAQRAQELLGQKGLLSVGELWERGPALVGEAAPDGLVATGFVALDGREERALAAACRGLLWVCAAPPGPAGDAARAVAGRLAEDAEEHGVTVERLDATGPFAPRAPVLEMLLGRVFTDGEPVAADVEVLLLDAAGPEAEPELLASTLAEAAENGAESIAVVVRDPERAWRELSPRLSSRGMAVRASWSRPASTFRQVRLFLAFAAQVTDLVAADKDWAPLDALRGLAAAGGSEDLEAELEDRAAEAVDASVGADRSWWPPRAVVDYLVAGPLGVSKEKAFELDAAWRGTRSVTPGEVLAQLFGLAGESGPFRSCLDALGAGDVGRAAEALLPLAAEKRDREAHSALLAVATAAQEAAGLLDAGRLDTDERLDLLEQLLASRSVGRSMERGRFDEELRCTVELLSPADAAALPQASVDLVVMVGQTAAEAPVEGLRAAESPLGRLAAALGLGPRVAPEVTARARAWDTWAAARAQLVLERALHDEGAAETQPSPMAVELAMSLAPGTVHRALGEERYARNLSAQGLNPEPSALEDPWTPGSIAPANARLMVAREDLDAGLSVEEAAAAARGLPVVSATAVERYLECPRRWFFEKALRSQEVDAGLTPLVKGNLVHRALEMAHREARDLGDPGAVERLVAPAFDRLVLEGVAGVGEGAATTPHSLADEGELRELRRNLQAVASFEGGCLQGFTPELFEAGFGTRDRAVEYGGASVVGFIDRVDVDPEGRAVVVDYKNKQSEASFREYAGPFEETRLEDWVPRHVQALMYAQVLRRLRPDLTPVGAVYLMTASHRGLWGLAEPAVAPAVYGPGLTPRTRGALTTENLGGVPFSEVLDRTEEVVAEAVKAMLAGNVEARPCDRRLCDGCPVIGCEGRR